MAKVLRMSPIWAIGCLCASAMNTQADYIFDFNRFFTREDAKVEIGIPASTAPPLEFELHESAVTVATKPVKTPKSNANHYSFYSATQASIDDRAYSALIDQKNETVSVPFRNNTRVASSAICGPSPASVEEIKALVATNADRYGVDPDFALAVTWTESKFDRVRNSPKGARGPMQLMPATARRFAVKDVCDPAENIAGGVRYLRVLLDEFKNPIFAAAAYNAGEGAIYDNGGVPPFPETVRYVASVINRQLGIDLPHKRRSQDGGHATDENLVASEVIGARSTKFVGGVMQF